MKNKMKLLAIGSLSAIFMIPCLAFAQNGDQKKTRHIRMTKIENGKKMEIDTVLTGDDVFVWNGDTLNPEKHIKRFSPSEFDKLHAPGMNPRQKDVKIYRHRGGANGEPFIMHGDSAEEFQIITDDGDTLGKKFIIHKMRRNGEQRDQLIYRHNLRGDNFPPVPPAPPVPHIKMFRHQSGNGINLNDPNVISYKKKDIGGGKEKIEIIRKKTNETEEMNVDIEMDHLMDVPEPPMPPSLDEEQEDQGNLQREKIEIEKSAVDKKAERKAAKGK